MVRIYFTLVLAMLAALATQARAQQPLPQPKLTPPFVTVDLNIGESQEVTLGEKKVAVKLVELIETSDTLRNAVRRATATVDVGGQRVALVSANYNLPVTAGGVQIDCPITRGYTKNSTKTTGGIAPWGLVKDARLRLWPAGSPWLNPDTFQYPAKQAWFASQTQMANEPTYVDGGERPGMGNVYYHYGLDIGGAEGLIDVVAATDGLVVSVGKEVLPGYDGTSVAPRYDVLYLLDDRGWFYRYSHLHTIAAGLKPGQTVRRGQPLGILGKEGGSGGWSHLHFDISGKQPSGQWGIIDGYAFLWEANLRERQPKLIGVARPHHFVSIGEEVQLDGFRSWSAAGLIAKFAWTCTDGQTCSQPRFSRTYDKPGVYSEILEVTDAEGRRDYDFAVVNVIDRAHLEQLPPSIHAAYSPTEGIKSGDTIKFLVRTFRTTDGEETWDFGDGTPPVTVHSDGNVVQLAKDGYAPTVHRYAKPGLYLARVQRTNRRGETATARLKILVGE